MSDAALRAGEVAAVTQVAAGGVDAYRLKNRQYFAGARTDFVDQLPDDPRASILEIGCGTGDTGALARARGKCGRYCGVELFEGAAREAATKLTEVVSGDVEKIAFPWSPGTFDALLMSEVLEHLVDPGATLRRLKPLLRPGAVVLAGSPNVAHYSVVLMLLRGDWRLTDKGVMDRTHLRWFTPRTYRELFESAGYVVESVRPFPGLTRKGSVVSALTFGRARHLFHRQTTLRARRP